MSAKTGTVVTCTYAGCRKPAVGELRAHIMMRKKPWPMCEEHLKPAAHPPDLRKKLHRWSR